jgi:hypothetical protein
LQRGLSGTSYSGRRFRPVATGSAFRRRTAETRTSRPSDSTSTKEPAIQPPLPPSPSPNQGATGFPHHPPTSVTPDRHQQQSPRNLVEAGMGVNNKSATACSRLRPGAAAARPRPCRGGTAPP